VNKELAAISQETLESVPLEKDTDRLTLKRMFVEGSPSDRIWGVGLRFNDKRLDNEREWKGTNRLGKCHDDACLIWGQ
jgi:hypothetical protein